MTDNLRNHLKTRADHAIALTNGMVPKALQKSPSEKHSEALRKKLLRGVKPEMEYQFECNGCTECRGGHFLRTCEKARRIEPCKNCGRMTMYRVDETKTFGLCPQCKARKEYV